MAKERALVLVVDDDDDIRDAISDVLGDEGYSVESAENGLEALKVLETKLPNVIVLDLMMPVMAGPEFRERQLADARFARVPVIVVSAAFDAGITAAALKANSFLPKPTAPGDLLREVARLV